MGRVGDNMDGMRGRRLVERLTVLGLGVLLVIFLAVKYRVGMVRYFDPDELQYLHWAYHFYRGDTPYVDYMLYITPVFFNVYSAVFRFIDGVGVFIGGRVLSFVLFTLLCGATAALFWVRRRSWIAILAPLVLVVMPLPSDKFVEIRPDTLAVLFVVIGLVFQIPWLRTGRKTFAFGAGLFYALSLLTLQKSLVSLSVVLLVSLIYGVLEILKGWNKYGLWIVARISTLWFGIGLIMPLGVFLGWACGTGRADLILYSITRLPFEVYSSSKIYYQVDPWFYLRPNDVYFGKPGYTFGYVANYALWLVGAVVAALGLLSLFRRRLTIARKLEEVLIPGMLVAQVFYYYSLPYKFLQHLVPLAVFLSVLVAEGVWLLWNICRKTGIGVITFISFVVILVAGLTYGYFDVNTPKLTPTNAELLDVLGKVMALIPKDKYVLDLSGGTIYYPDPYYICCMAYGTFYPFLTLQLPSLTEALVRTQTKYLFGGENTILSVPEPDKEYIKARYSPMWGGLLYVANDVLPTLK